MTILNNLKKKLDAKKDLWFQELNNVMWAYKTTHEWQPESYLLGYVIGLKQYCQQKLMCLTTLSNAINDFIHDGALTLEADLLDGKHVTP